MTSSALSRPVEVGTLAIVTPSLIGSGQRAAFARASLAELRDQLGEKYVHIVADDVPMCRGRLFNIIPNRLTRRIPNFFYINEAKRIYLGGANVELLRGAGGNSLTGVLRALTCARERGCDYAFLHLDDNAYTRTLDELMACSVDALDALPELQVVRLSAYPILTGACDGERGNLSLCELSSDTVRFDSVVLHPLRRDRYTVWQAPWESVTADGRFWPIILWNAVYRIDFLERLLSNPSVAGLAGLGPAEAWYKENWAGAWSNLKGAFGFINMQFGGLERERNLNWQELLALPNRPIR
jgi:hypothetical protein